MTLKQRINLKKFFKKKNTKAPALNHCPQRKAICLRVFNTSPKKPNSAKRKVARVNIYSLNKEITVYIPGENHKLAQFGIVLVRGGRTSDVPGLRYKAIRGKYDVRGVDTRQNGRSKYGTKSTLNRVRVFYKKKKQV
jgi:small subunit ribosomal protein S12